MPDTAIPAQLGQHLISSGGSGSSGPLVRSVRAFTAWGPKMTPSGATKARNPRLKPRVRTSAAKARSASTSGAGLVTGAGAGSAHATLAAASAITTPETSGAWAMFRIPACRPSKSRLPGRTQSAPTTFINEPMEGARGRMGIRRDLQSFPAES